MLEKSRHLIGELVRGRHSSDFGAQLIVYALRIVSGVLVGAYVARYLGPSKLGIISLLLTLTAIVAPFLDLGTKQAMIKMLAQKDGSINRVFWTVLLVKLVLGAGIFIILAWLALSGFFESLAGHGGSIVLLGLGAILLSPFIQFECTLIAAVKNKALMAGQILSLLCSTIMRACCVYYELGLDYFLAANLFTILLGALNFLITSYHHKLIPKFAGLDFTKFTQVLSENWPLIVSGLAITLYMRTDIVMIEYFLSEKEVGHYWVANRLLEIMYFIPLALTKTLSARVYERLKADDLESNQRAMRAIFQLCGSSSVLLTLVAAAGGAVLIPLLYGESYVPSVAVFCLSICALPAVALGLARGIYLVHAKKTMFGMYATLLGLAINLSLNIVMIPRWGILGASVSTLVSYYVSAVLSTGMFMEKWLFKAQVKSMFENPKWGYQYLRNNEL